MDDPQRRPGSTERDRLTARIRHAADEGRITAADRDIRLGNVSSAQSMAELDLIGHDLDQLEAALPAGAPAAPAWSGASGASVADQLRDQLSPDQLAHQVATTARATGRSIGVVTVVMLVLLLAAGGVVTLFTVHSSSSTSQGALFDPSPVPSDQPVDDPSTATGDPGRAAPAYALTGQGIRAFVRLYWEKFGTTEVIDAVLYGDYAVVQVPQTGAKRHAGFVYRRGQGWMDFGGITANFPGARPVDLSSLDVPALVRNVARARRSLGVEDPTTTYVVIRQYAPADAVPSVDIYVSNAFNESGYLATQLDGTVERAYPYAQ